MKAVVRLGQPQPGVVDAVLDSAGLSFDDVVSVQVYLTEMADFHEMNAAYERHFTAPYPARTTIGCASLPLKARVEIGCIAEMRRTGE